jgi:hypothetical protein
MGKRAAAAGLIVVLAVVAVARLRLLDAPLERDEGEYGYMGQLITQGVPPYVEAYNMKLPGTYAAYAVFLALFGDSAAAIRLGLLLTNLASIVFVFFLARAVEGNGPALAAAATFAALSLSPSVYGPFAHATHFVMLFALAGLLCLVRARTGRWWEIFGGGVLLGTAILMKQNGAFFAGFGLLMVAVAEWRTEPRRLDRAARRLALLIAGILLPLVIVGLLLLRAGAFSRFWFWVVSYGQAYVGQVPLGQAGVYFSYTFSPVVASSPLLWTLVVAGFVLCVWKAWRTRRIAFTLAFAVVSAAAVSPGFWFRPHYYVLFLPAAALLAATFSGELCRRLTPRLGAPTAAIVAAAAVALAVGQELYRDRFVLFEASPTEASRFVYGTNPFPEAVEVGGYLRGHMAPAERVAVIGSEPEIYFYAQRRAATGYLYTYPLMEPQPFARRMQEEMIHEIEAASPAYVVFVNGKFSWLARDGSDMTIIEWANTFLRSRYQIVGAVDIDEDGPSRYVWGEEAARVRSPAADRILVWKRRAAAMRPVPPPASRF